MEFDSPEAFGKRLANDIYETAAKDLVEVVIETIQEHIRTDVYSLRSGNSQWYTRTGDFLNSVSLKQNKVNKSGGSVSFQIIFDSEKIHMQTMSRGKWNVHESMHSTPKPVNDDFLVKIMDTGASKSSGSLYEMKPSNFIQKYENGMDRKLLAKMVLSLRSKGYDVEVV